MTTYSFIIKNLFCNVSQELLKSKILNIFAVLEKGQKSSTLTVSAEDLKKAISQALLDRVSEKEKLTKETYI